MKILIYGAGVIGSIFAAKLSSSGQDVTVLARAKRYEEITNDGIVLCNPGTGEEEIVRVKVINHLYPEDQYDYIFVVMQRTQVDAVLDPLSKNSSKTIVFVVNTAAGYEHWENVIGAGRILIGFPSAGGERKDGRVNYFIGKGLIRLFQTTTFGDLSGKKTHRVAEVIQMFNKAGIPSVFCSNMDAWQKTHVAMVTCIANALYGYGCDNRRLATSWKDVKEMILGVKEGFAVLRRLDIPITPRKLKFFELSTSILTAVFQIILGTQLAEITMAKHSLVARNEILCLQEEFDYLIRKSGLTTPHIDALKRNLTQSLD